MTDVLERLERYYDEVPRANADAIDLGPFTLFVSRVSWPYYARPRLGVARAIDPSDVVALLRQQDERGVPRTIEWVAETTPSLLGAARVAGLAVETLPLLVLGSPLPFDAPPGIVVRRLVADDPDVAAARAVAAVAFGHGGTARSLAGAAERDIALADRAAADAVATSNELLRRGLTAGAVIFDAGGDFGGGVIASGMYNRRDAVAEVVAVATLPVARRRGVAATLTAALIEQAREEAVRTVFLSAGSQDVARVYRRIGFVDVGTAHVAGSR